MGRVRPGLLEVPFQALEQRDHTDIGEQLAKEELRQHHSALPQEARLPASAGHLMAEDERAASLPLPLPHGARHTCAWGATRALPQCDASAHSPYTLQGI